MEVCRHSRDSKAAVEVFEAMETEGVRPGVRSYTSLLKVRGGKGKEPSHQPVYKAGRDVVQALLLPPPPGFGCCGGGGFSGVCAEYAFLSSLLPNVFFFFFFCHPACLCDPSIVPRLLCPLKMSASPPGRCDISSRTPRGVCAAVAISCRLPLSEPRVRSLGLGGETGSCDKQRGNKPPLTFYG